MDPREREAREAKQRQNKELLDRAYDRVVSSQLSKLSAKKTYTEGIDKHHIIYELYIILYLYLIIYDTKCTHIH